ncbi:MAG: phosphatidylserine decarboxylase 1 [Lichina confinis]|nr:MAG: phosphatidylserine decarboxylase 1 [Lichina confinis]
MSILPLKALSRVWGRFNEHDIPKPLRLPGFKLYSKIFGVDLSEVSESDLRQYPNLSAFFYRTLKPGCRPLDSDPDALLSPADGRVLQFGTIEQGKVEQVKGITYRLDALLGSIDVGTSPNPSAPSNIFGRGESELDKDVTRVTQGNEDRIGEDEEFARVNGIAYTLPDLISGAAQEDPSSSGTQTDVSMEPAPSSEARVTADLELSRASAPWYSRFTSQNKTALYYAVIYLAPGDYHRFHSPANWVVERRRHFAGELYSVSPYLQRLLPGLFTINERVVLLGRWRWGFFSFIPVGATNVGSIKVNFDRELKTNSLTADTAAKKAAKGAAKRGETQPGYAEASYEAASRVLRGHALQRGEEMGGFQLGSSIVLVFEGPAGGPDAGWRWVVEKGQRIKVGEALGRLEKE